MASVKMRHAGLERNKRCLLAYLYDFYATFRIVLLTLINNAIFLFSYNRLHRIKEMRWEFGSILPAEIRTNLSEKEVS